MILTADVLSHVAQCEQAMKVSCNNADQSACTSDTVNELNTSLTLLILMCYLMMTMLMT